VNSFGMIVQTERAEEAALDTVIVGSPRIPANLLTMSSDSCGTVPAGRAALRQSAWGHSYWARRGCLMGGVRPLTGCLGMSLSVDFQKHASKSIAYLFKTVPSGRRLV